MFHQIMRLNYLFKISWLKINERKCYRMYVTLINHDIIDIYLIKEIYCQFFVNMKIYMKEINVQCLIAIRIEDDQRRTSLEM